MVSVAYAIVSALVVLGLLIVFHELGHFLVAKKMGVGVLTFSVGFGPKLLGRRIGETEYVLSAVPLGGYVKMVGEDPDEEVQEEDRQRSFSHQSLYKRTAIVAAGPLFNLLFSVLVFTVIFTVFGTPVLTTRVGGVEAGSPAAQADLQKNDRIVRVDGGPIQEWEELSRRIKESEGKPLVLSVQREGEELELTVQPVERTGANIYGEERKIWVIGIASAVEVRKRSPWIAAGQAVYKTGEYAVLTLVALFKMVTGTLSPSNLGGPLLIAQMAGEQAREGLWNFLFFMAILSVNLGVLNLLPIPVLDGGHLFFFLLESVIGRPVELKYRERAQQIGISVLILIMIYAFYNDIGRFFSS